MLNEEDDIKKVTKLTIKRRFDKFITLCNLYDYTAVSFYFLRQLDYAIYLQKKNGICTGCDYINISYKFKCYVNPYEVLNLKVIHEKTNNNNKEFVLDIVKYKNNVSMDKRELKMLLNKLNEIKV